MDFHFDGNMLLAGLAMLLFAGSYKLCDMLMERYLLPKTTRPYSALSEEDQVKLCVLSSNLKFYFIAASVFAVATIGSWIFEFRDFSKPLLIFTVFLLFKTIRTRRKVRSI